MISLDRVTVRHDNGFEALRDVTLRIPTGSLVYVLGRAGSGKTTLLDVIAGLRRPSGGAVSVGGVDLAGLDAAQLAVRRRRIGQVFRTPRLDPELTVGENVSLPLDVRGLGRADRAQRVETALEIVGLSAHRDTRPAWLNRLEQQRASVARAIAMEPELILADEPTALLDRESAEDLEQLLTQLATAARSVLVATQDRESSLTRRHARIVLLNKGFLIDDQAPEGRRG